MQLIYTSFASHKTKLNPLAITQHFTPSLLIYFQDRNSYLGSDHDFHLVNQKIRSSGTDNKNNTDTDFHIEESEDHTVFMAETIGI